MGTCNKEQHTVKMNTHTAGVDSNKRTVTNLDNAVHSVTKWIKMAQLP